jgi:hypothetical protein
MRLPEEFSKKREVTSSPVDTVGEASKQRTYAFHSTEYEELTRLRLNSPTVSPLPKAHDLSS